MLTLNIAFDMHFVTPGGEFEGGVGSEGHYRLLPLLSPDIYTPRRQSPAQWFIQPLEVEFFTKMPLPHICHVHGI